MCVDEVPHLYVPIIARPFTVRPRLCPPQPEHSLREELGWRLAMVGGPKRLLNE